MEADITSLSLNHNMQSHNRNDDREAQNISASDCKYNHDKYMNEDDNAQNPF